MTEEFNLSEKRIKNIPSFEGGNNADLYYEEDVKEFIRLLKVEWDNWGIKEEVLEFSDIIDKLAGDKLT